MSNLKKKSQNSQFAIGHQYKNDLSFKILQDYQNNLISLLSHEMNTPLMEITSQVEMALVEKSSDKMRSHLEEAKNKIRNLSLNIHALMNLANIDRGVLNVDWREVDSKRFFDFFCFITSVKKSKTGKKNILLDPAKMNLFMELFFNQVVLFSHAKPKIFLNDSVLRVECQMTKESVQSFLSAWEEANIIIKANQSITLQTFSEILTKEKEFLKNHKDGLKHELIIAAQLLTLQKVNVEVLNKKNRLVFSFKFLTPDSMDNFKLVMESRLRALQINIDSMAVVVFKDLKLNEYKKLSAHIKNKLFRSTDSVYSLFDHKVLIVVLDHIPKEHIGKMVKRILTGYKGKLKWEKYYFPADASEKEKLMRKISS